jgi:AAA+ superfamily predicted ATPase
MIDALFETVTCLPDLDLLERYQALVGLDEIKDHLEKEAEVLLRPDLLEKWSKEKHGVRLPALDLLSRRPPLIIFAGDVGTGKTELATTFGDNLARRSDLSVELYSLSLKARGSGAVGEMTRLIGEAFKHVRNKTPKPHHSNKRPSAASILLIDEADALAQSREMAQMHHEDRAGVNALIRGIDDIANGKIPCLIVMCTNRLDALDPAVRRRAAMVFDFKRPGVELRKQLLQRNLEGSSLSQADIAQIAERLGADDSRDYGFTVSDITQRLIPAIVLKAYPSARITKQLAFEVVERTAPTPPFKMER